MGICVRAIYTTTRGLQLSGSALRQLGNTWRKRPEGRPKSTGGLGTTALRHYGTSKICSVTALLVPKEPLWPQLHLERTYLSSLVTHLD